MNVFNITLFKILLHSVLDLFVMIMRHSVSPEVLHELLELVCASRQWDDDVDQDGGCVHPLIFHLHQWSKGTEEDQASELIACLSSEGQLVQRPFVLLCPSDAWQVRNGHEHDKVL